MRHKSPVRFPDILFRQFIDGEPNVEPPPAPPIPISNQSDIHKNIAGSYIKDTSITPIDIIFSATLLIAAFPCLILIYGIIFALGEDPIFLQKRVGQQERHFTLFKFRTLPRKASQFQPRWRRDGFRIFGDLLRNTGLDETLQLLNILKGDMVFFGPRPLMIRDHFDLPPERVLRSQVKPGLTGLVQVYGGRDLSPAEKLRVDLWFITHKDWRMHLHIALLTLGRALRLHQVESHRPDAFMARRGISQLSDFTSPPHPGTAPQQVQE